MVGVYRCLWVFRVVVNTVGRMEGVIAYSDQVVHLF